MKNTLRMGSSYPKKDDPPPDSKEEVVLVPTLASAPYMKWERKFTTHYYAEQSLTAAGWITCLNDIAAGIDYDERLGRKIQSDYMNLVVTCRAPATANRYDRCRVMVVFDHQPNATQLAITDILDLGVCSSDFFAPVNIKTWPTRFTVLEDWRSGLMCCSTSGFYESGKTTKVWKRIALPKKGSCVTSFAGTTATIPTTGAVYVCVFGQQNDATASNNVTVGFCANYYFTDV